MRKFTALIVALQLVLPSPLLAAGLSYKEQLREHAEHDCYDDVQRLCADKIPDEGLITACMRTNRKQLSPACGKVFDLGID